MKCPHCGKEITNGSKFCEFCGKPVKQKNNNLVAIIIALVVLLLGACCAILFLAVDHHGTTYEIYQETPTDTIMAVDPVDEFPVRDKVKDMLKRFLSYSINDDYDGLREIYAPTLGRYHDIKKQISRDEVIDKHRNYNSKFGVYGKHGSYRWETLTIKRISNTRAEVVCVQDYYIDRYDNTKYTDFVLEQHFVINDNYQIVSIYDVQLSKR
jgi:hypothetical protein